jgi:tetratricopeptide (TPR) repeat protein
MSRRTIFTWCITIAVIAATTAFLIWRYPSPKPELSAEKHLPTPQQNFPLPPFSASRFLNTAADASYVGIAVCKGCHSGNYRSYLHTAHSRALSDLDLKAEPPDGAFEHKASGGSYRVYRQGTQLRHGELLRTEAGKEVARVDLPIRYLIGSGHFCRSYLVEVDGFLHESPITWYAQKKSWGMSPGYDVPGHWGFERAVKIGCLNCHVGRAEPEDGSVHRMIIHEQPIGCENCHGPGSKHVAFHRAGKLREGEEDRTIVNPARLSRARLEAICAVCHLNGVASIPLRGRQVGEFRPGMLLTDYRTDYRFDTGSERMTVVGHMQQLRRSLCYQGSKDLSCLTCHDPHAPEKPKDPIAFYRQKCLKCHAAKDCSLATAERLKKNAADDCVACHMPRGDTDIPHVAFTHHKIGVHQEPGQSNMGVRAPELVPLEDVTRLPPIDQERNLGLAYLRVSTEADSPDSARYRLHAQQHLESVYGAGLRDGEIAAALAEIYAKQGDYAHAAAMAQEALQAKELANDRRAVVHLVLANYHIQERQFAQAAGLLEKLTRMRRHAEDWRVLGLVYLQQNEPAKAVQALSQALAIRPERAEIHLGLSQAYEQLGDRPNAEAHREKAQWLMQHQAAGVRG